MEGMGEGMLYFLLLRSVKRQERPLGQSVLTNFVTIIYIYIYVYVYAYLSLRQNVYAYVTSQYVW